LIVFVRCQRYAAIFFSLFIFFDVIAARLLFADIFDFFFFVAIYFSSHFHFFIFSAASIIFDYFQRCFFRCRFFFLFLLSLLIFSAAAAFLILPLDIFLTLISSS